MLENLGVELWGQVLRHLSPTDLRYPQLDDLQSARQATRVFEQASREHLERSETIQLSAFNAGGARGGPDWTRFPRLRPLELVSLKQGDGEALCALFAPGGAGLSSLREVYSYRDMDAASWSALLEHAPAVRSVTILTSEAMHSDACLAAVATLASMAPQLSSL